MAKKRKRTGKINRTVGNRSDNHSPEEPAKETIPIQEKKTGELSTREFACSLLVLAGLFVYLIYFIFVKTEFGNRFFIYLELVLKSQIYWSFWTGSPNGTIALLDRWPILLGFIFHLGVAYGLGQFLARTIFPLKLRPVENEVLSIGLGLSLISTFTLVIGLFQLYPWKQNLLVPLLGFAVYGIWKRPANLSFEIQSERIDHQNGRWINWMVLLGLPFACFILLASALPPWEYDVREYHFQVPKEWFQHGGIFFLPHNVYGSMPLGTELHALFAMLYSFGPDDWWWGSLIGKMISGSFAVLGGLAIYCVGHRIFGKFAGVSASLIYISTPWVTANSIVGYNETAFGCYVALAILLVLIVTECDEVKTQTNNNIKANVNGLAFGLGLLVGAAMSCKYTAVPFFGLPFLGLYLAWQLKMKGWRMALPVTTWLLFGCFLNCGFWFAKNLAFTGNPFYPLMASVIDSPRTVEQIAQWNAAHSPPTTPFAWSHLLEKLFLLFFTFKWLGVIAAPLAVFSFLHERKRWVIALWFWILFAFATWFLFTHRIERFLLPFYPVFCLLAGAGLGWCQNAKWKTPAFFVLLGACSLNLLLSTSRLVGDVRILAPLESLDTRKLKAKDYSHPEDQIVPLYHLSPAISWINANHPDAKVLFFGECRPWNAEFPVIYNTCFDDCQTRQLLQDGHSDQTSAILKQNGITHVLVHASELNRLKNTYGYDVNQSVPIFGISDVLDLEGKILKKINTGIIGDSQDPSVQLFEVILDEY